MEVTTVSPSPASPTEGDDLCEIDVTDVAIHSVTLLICLCGLVGNGAVLCLLRRKIHNTAIYNLAFADFLLLLFTVSCALLFLSEDLSCSPIMPPLPLNFLSQLPVVSYCWVLFQLMHPDNIVEGFRRWFRCSAPQDLWWFVFGFRHWVSVVLFSIAPAMINLCPTHKQEHCQVALFSMYTFFLLLFAETMVFFHASMFMRGSKKPKPKRRDIVLFLIGVFILIISLCNLLQLSGYTVVSSQFFFLLNSIHSSIKPFIYFWAGSCRSPCSLSSLQLSLQRVFDE